MPQSHVAFYANQYYVEAWILWRWSQGNAFDSDIDNDMTLCLSQRHRYRLFVSIQKGGRFGIGVLPVVLLEVTNVDATSF